MAEHLRTYVEFPPRQRPGSFSLDAGAGEATKHRRIGLIVNTAAPYEHQLKGEMKCGKLWFWQQRLSRSQAWKREPRRILKPMPMLTGISTCRS